MNFSFATLSTLYQRKSLFATSSSQSPHLILEYYRSEFWASDESDANPFILFDLRNRKIKPTGYTIRSPNFNPNTCQPKSWQLSVGDSLDSLQIIHRVKDSNDINGPLLFKYFQIPDPKTHYRYIVFQQIGPNSGGKSQLFIDSIEFFGEIISSLGEDRCLF
jgi:hypothetical protein